MSTTGQYTYRNKTDRELTLMGVGVVEAGGEITTDEPVTNPNLELVKGPQQFKSKSEQRRVEASQAATKPKDKE